MRSGLETDYGSLVRLFFIYLGVTSGPFLIFRFLHVPVRAIVFIYPPCSIFLLVVPIILAPSWSTYLYPILGAGGFLSLSVVVNALPRKKLIRSMRSSLILFFLLTSVNVIAAVSAKFSQDVSHFLTQEMAFLNLLHRDTLHHVAISNMVQLFQYPSSGLDGTGWLHYHAGSHYWFGALSNALGISTLATYPIGHLLLITLFWYFLFLCTINVSRFLYQDRSRIGLFVGLLALVVSDYVIYPLDISTYYTSESFTFSLLVLFASLSSFIGVIHYQILERKFFFVAFLTLLSNGLLLVTKIVPSLFVSGIFSCLLIARKSNFTQLVIWFFFLGTSSLLAIYYLTPIGNILGNNYSPGVSGSHPFRVNWNFQLSEITSLITCAVFVVLYYFSTIIYVEAKKRRVRNRRLYVHCVVLTVTAVLITGVTDFFNSVREYLYITSGLVSLSLIAPMVTRHIVHRWEQRKGGKSERMLYASISTSLVIIVIISSSILIYNLEGKYRNLSKSAVHSALQLYDGTVASNHPNVSLKDFFVTNLAQHHSLFSPKLAAAISNSFWPSLRKTTEKASTKYGPTHTAVFVPPTNINFWKYSEVDTCSYRPSYIPALLGIPALKGLPPKGTKCEYIGIGHDFSAFSASSHSSNIKNSNLCAYAQKQGIRRVIILENFLLPISYRIVDCN